MLVGQLVVSQDGKKEQVWGQLMVFGDVFSWSLVIGQILCDHLLLVKGVGLDTQFSSVFSAVEVHWSSLPRR